MKLKRRMKYYLLRLFRIKASPHQVALGLSLGFAPNWFPTFGLGPIMSVGIAKLTKVNMLAAVVGGILGSPLWPFLFLFNYRIGSLFFNKTSEVSEVSKVEYLEAVNDTVGSLQTGSLTFITGAFVNVLLFSFVLYLIVFMLFRKYRISILEKLKMSGR